MRLFVRRRDNVTVHMIVGRMKELREQVMDRESVHD